MTLLTEKIDGEFYGLHFTIVAKDNATQRTKNRIRERGPTFRLVSVVERSLLFDEKAVLLNSTDDKWMGWLPVREIEIVEVNDP